VYVYHDLDRERDLERDLERDRDLERVRERDLDLDFRSLDLDRLLDRFRDRDLDRLRDRDLDRLRDRDRDRLLPRERLRDLRPSRLGRADSTLILAPSNFFAIKPLDSVPSIPFIFKLYISKTWWASGNPD